jgi:heme/copper-type cytochrome/quinol oxidase subunit 2
MYILTMNKTQLKTLGLFIMVFLVTPVLILLAITLTR